MSEDIGNQRGCALKATRQRVRRRHGEIHHEALCAQVTPKLLSEQGFDVGLIIHHQNQYAHV